MKRTSVLLICFLMLSLASCMKDSVTEPFEPAQPGIIPLKVGYKWTTTSTLYDSTGNVVSYNTGTTEVTRDTIIQGEKWYKMGPENKLNNILYTNRNDGYYQLTSTKITQIFQTALDDTTKECSNPYNRYLVAKDVKIKTALGEFSCYLYRWYSTTSGKRLISENSYVVPNIGVIRGESYTGPIGRRYVFVVTELIATNVF